MLINHQLTAKRRDLGQVFTPDHVASLMASMFSSNSNELSILDAGAGKGALVNAFIHEIISRKEKPTRIKVSAFEKDIDVIRSLEDILKNCKNRCSNVNINFTYEIVIDDFIEYSVKLLSDNLLTPDRELLSFDLAITNPPYKKINSTSTERKLLSSIGIETSNMYSAFISLIVPLLKNNGEIVAITPRSFCNGPYFKPYREFLLKNLSIDRIHTFELRNAAFGEDEVLQENIIFHAKRSIKQIKRVMISKSTGQKGAQIYFKETDFHEIVSPTDSGYFIHIPSNGEQTKSLKARSIFSTKLEDLGINVSTGRVVDFRAQKHLSFKTTKNTIPLIYPHNFNGFFIKWPSQNTSKKPISIEVNAETEFLLIPSGTYVVVKRFSSKEEKKRIVACIIDPTVVSHKFVGIENHLNYFHSNGNGVDFAVAKGLFIFLNSTLIDNYFRRFSGHTQVNATDLKSLHYPSKDQLIQMGSKISAEVDQQTIDNIMNEVCSNAKFTETEVV